MQATATTIEAPSHGAHTIATRASKRDVGGGKQVRVVNPSSSKSGSWLFCALIAVVLWYGWNLRDEGYLTAESGLGYALGIVGGILMLLLLLYPLRKRVRKMRRWLHIRHWFRMHMLFGILGPICILLHSGFRFGSANGSVAMISMLSVAASGLVGRYLYTKIHYGLYGRRATLNELKLSCEVCMLRAGFAFDFSPRLSKRIQSFHASAMAPANNVFHGIARILFMGFRTRWVYWSIVRHMNRALHREARQRGWARKVKERQRQIAKRQLKGYLMTARQVIELNFYERLFALWHVLHLPLFILLLITGVLHVVAVHMY